MQKVFYGRISLDMFELFRCIFSCDATDFITALIFSVFSSRDMKHCIAQLSMARINLALFQHALSLFLYLFFIELFSFSLVKLVCVVVCLLTLLLFYYVHGFCQISVAALNVFLQPQFDAFTLHVIGINEYKYQCFNMYSNTFHRCKQMQKDIIYDFIGNICFFISRWILLKFPSNFIITALFGSK